MTLKEVIDFAQARTNTVGDGRFPFLLLREYTNQAQREIQMQMWQSGFRKFEKSASLTTSLTSFYSTSRNNGVVAALPTDLLEVPEAVRMVVCAVTGTGANEYMATEVNELSLPEIINNGFLAPTLQKPVYVRMNNNIFVFPGSHSTYTIYY